MRTAEEFWACVNKDGPIHPVLGTQCWLWTRGIHKTRGYGSFNFGGITTLAHRFSYLITHGDLGKLCVLHKCDNRKCVNPEHLFTGTTQINTEDMVPKGRQAKGSQQPDAKLTEEFVTAIREKYAKGGITQQELAKEYGVGRRTIGRAVSHRTWKHT